MTSFRFWLFAGFVLVFAACYEKQEGCLDIGATNFDVTADKPCADECCTYPVIKMSVSSVYSDLVIDTMYSFKLDKLYEVPGRPGDSIAFSRIRYFVSNVELLSGGTVFGVPEELDLFINGQSTIVSDNFGRFEPSVSPSATLGSFAKTGTFDGVRFTFGLEPAIIGADPDSIPSGHPLSIQSDSTLWLEGAGYQSVYLELFRDQTAVDSTVIPIEGSMQLEFDFSEPYEVLGGFDLTLKFQIDFSKWFTGTNPKDDPIPMLRQKILENVSDSFLFLGF
ncbi:MAG: hypothetical protein KDC34_11340 [Saprospiraceae bacterium]|nr:hypothetical protein [Saprospiraceae bacterium]